MNLVRDNWILGIDVETTGLDPEKDVITELGYAIYDTIKNIPLHMVNVHLKWAESPGISPEIEAITGINQEMLDVFAADADTIFKGLMWAMSHCSMVLAHNAPFDKEFLENAFKRLGMEMPEMDWVDTSVDIDFPQHWKGRSLTYLAGEHGFVNPFKHRALTDSLTMLKMTDTYNMYEVHRRSKLPSFKFIADLPKPWPPHDMRPKGKRLVDIAKGIGFRFESESKDWVRIVKEDEVEALKVECKKNGIKGRVAKC